MTALPALANRVAGPESAGSRRAPRISVTPEPWSSRLYVVTLTIALTGLAARSLFLLAPSAPGAASLQRWFWLDREMGVPAWFSTILLFGCAQVMWALAHTRGAGGLWGRHERALAVVFVALSIDELTEIHEQAIAPLQNMFGLTGPLAFAWVVLAVPLTAAFAFAMRNYLRALPPRTRRTVIAAGCLYVLGAAGVEMIGSALWVSGGPETFSYSLVATVEETLEMIGLVLFLGAVSALWRERRRTADEVAQPPSTIVLP